MRSKTIKLTEHTIRALVSQYPTSKNDVLPRVISPLLGKKIDALAMIATYFDKKRL